MLSDEFLAEIRQTDKKNLAIEALKKLINGDVRAQSRRNVTQSRAFTERLEAAISRYHANALTTAQVSGSFDSWLPASPGTVGAYANRTY